MKPKIKPPPSMTSEGGSTNQVIAATPISYKQPEDCGMDTTKLEKVSIWLISFVLFLCGYNNSILTNRFVDRNVIVNFGINDSIIHLRS